MPMREDGEMVPRIFKFEVSENEDSDVQTCHLRVKEADRNPKGYNNKKNTAKLGAWHRAQNR